jgi:hypothetical protein
MARFELRLYMTNGCGQALLGDVTAFEADGEDAARAEARQRVRQLPKNCFGALYDAAGAQIWEQAAPGR